MSLVHRCVGVKPNTACLKASPVVEAWGFRESVVVNDQLQLVGQPRIFAVGDVMSHSSRELTCNGHVTGV